MIRENVGKMKSQVQNLVRKPEASILVIIIALLFLVPLFWTNVYFLHLMTSIFIWIILGEAWNILAGYAGQISFGHAAFFGVGAYTTALLFTQLGILPWLAMVIGGAVAALFSIPIGIITFRLRGPYFSLSTFAFAEILRLIAVNWRSFTKGAVGILYPVLSLGELMPYYVVMFSALLTIFLLWKLLGTKVGYYFITIREDQDVASSLAINTTAYKLFALLVSAFFTGIAGGFYSNYMKYIDPELAFSGVDISLATIVVVMVGGLGTLAGPVIGAVIVVLLSELLRDLFPFAHLLFYGVLVCLVVLYMPEGMIKVLRILIKRLTSALRKLFFRRVIDVNG